MFNCRSLIVILFLGIISTVHEGSAASSDVAIRERRDSGGSINILQLYFRVEKLISSCKKPNLPPPNNQTNAIVQFIESHDLQCLIDGAIKLYQDMTPNQAGTRRKRDINSMMIQFFKLTEDIDHCKKDNPQPAGNSTNFFQEVMNQYDLGCVMKGVMTFLKSISASSNQLRAKRAIKFTDLTCFALKVLDDEKKITDLVKSFESHSGKQGASPEKTCNDFGVALNHLIEFVSDFAPGSSSAS